MSFFNTYIKNLAFLDIDKNNEILSCNFSAFKSGSNLKFCNRAYVNENIISKDIVELKKYYSSIPFTIWMDEKNSAGIDLVSQMKFKHCITYPLMKLDFKDYVDHEPKVQVKEISTEFEILNTWVPLVTNIFNISDFLGFQTYIKCLIDKSRFFLGYHENTPVATSMAIYRTNTIDIHWVGTLPQNRNQGFGYAVSCATLSQFATRDKTPILYASDLGKPVYEKIGFQEQGRCHVFIPENA